MQRRHNVAFPVQRWYSRANNIECVLYYFPSRSDEIFTKSSILYIYSYPPKEVWEIAFWDSHGIEKEPGSNWGSNPWPWFVSFLHQQTDLTSYLQAGCSRNMEGDESTLAWKSMQKAESQNCAVFLRPTVSWPCRLDWVASLFSTTQLLGFLIYKNRGTDNFRSVVLKL